MPEEYQRKPLRASPHASGVASSAAMQEGSSAWASSIEVSVSRPSTSARSDEGNEKHRVSIPRGIGQRQEREARGMRRA